MNSLYDIINVFIEASFVLVIFSLSCSQKHCWDRKTSLESKFESLQIKLTKDQWEKDIYFFIDINILCVCSPHRLKKRKHKEEVRFRIYLILTRKKEFGLLGVVNYGKMTRKCIVDEGY